ncbi:hypothetical protein OAF98_00785 [Planctomicrobium sp.]|jgi:hypothetical protein|nr:hypothetical protein [Planctomicrobium sp.]MDA7504142.1 hypothetical protein [bacterium]MDA7527634.1 hypothetical protein [bacterium]MDB4731484.1 hypothetical protein [bacterium]MDB4742994.1 hypothetical protein [Planctomicrobium sp.]
MTEPNQKELQHWMESAAQFGDSDQIQQQIIRAGKFMKELGALQTEEICRYLAMIDFSMSITVVRLPNSVFVQYQEENQNYWYTDIGYSSENVAHASRLRRRLLFTPRAVAPALKLTALDIKDSHSIQGIFTSLSPSVKAKFGQPARGAGTQYLMLKPNLMKEI